MNKEKSSNDINNNIQEKFNIEKVLYISDKEFVHTKFGSSESNTNLGLLNNNQNDLFVENINKKENANTNKDEGYNNVVENLNEIRNLNSNHCIVKNKKENLIFDPFGKKIIQDYNKKHNIKYKNPLKITCLELFFNCFICKKEIKQKKKIFDMAEEKFNYNLDILTYLKRMLVIDILKYLILDKNLLNI